MDEYFIFVDFADRLNVLCGNMKWKNPINIF